MGGSGARWVRLVAASAAGVLLVAGCSGNPGGDADGDGTVTLKIGIWGDFGINDLKARYEAANPHIKISVNTGEYNAQHEDLQKKLIAGNGAPDIAAIDEGFVVQFRGQADKFVNLLDRGAAQYETRDRKSVV